MDKKKFFRPINKFEYTIINNSLRDSFPELLSFIESGENFIYIQERGLFLKENYPKIYVISERIKKVIEEFHIDNCINSSGLYFGFMKRGRFFISLEAIDYFFNKKIISVYQKVKLNEKGKKSFLYGNKITKNMIIQETSHFKAHNFLLVFDKNNELMGIAKSLIDYKDFQILKPKNIIALNLNNKGYFLRKEQ